MIKFNRERLYDKIYACWIGKNIGGTMGTPYEGSRALNDISGFVTPPGEPLPNDDLDLQLVWLRAMDEVGIDKVDSKVLGEYWMSYVGPCWNEYGVCKANMATGILPPLSGELHNEEWKHSNGAWIRTEIWASVFPGDPENAIRYAFEDACVDHGFGEGSYAAIFVAAMESAAFIIDDIHTLIRIGLSKIPTDCRVARSVRIVLDGHKQGLDWKTVREQLVEDSADLGWFQAPANVAFAILGLLFGGCDFKKSMILAINCGDDTDCTGATVGALLGIMKGTAGIPEDWRQYIGDNIATIAIIRGTGYFPSTCAQLTQCVMNLIPTANRTDNWSVIRGETKIELTDGPDDFSEVTPESFLGSAFVDHMFQRSHYSYTVSNCYATVLVEYETEPVITPGGSLKGRITVIPEKMENQKHFQLRWVTPEGWHVAGRNSLFTAAPQSAHTEHAFVDFTIVAGDTVAPTNRLIADLQCMGRPAPILVPLTILG